MSEYFETVTFVRIVWCSCMVYGQASEKTAPLFWPTFYLTQLKNAFHILNLIWWNNMFLEKMSW